MKNAGTEVNTRRPFPGLRPFEPHESDLFYGRGDQIDDLLTRLEDHRFVAVVGASGSGKSSLVRAGLLPSLEAGFLSETGTEWRMVMMRPGKSPFSRLAVALHDTIGGDESADLENAAAFTEATLRSGPRGLVEAIQDMDLPSGTNVLVLVDQFEEIFRFRHRGRSRGKAAESDTDQGNDDHRNDATAFVNMLLATASCELPVYIVLTMRSDFLGDCDAFHGLPEAINDCQFLVPRLRRDQIRDTITGPLDLFGARADEGLVNRILNEIGSDPDQLPLMQHLLLRMWTRELQTPGEPVLEVSDYVAVGGLEDALSQHADEAYDELGDADSKRVAELMFRCLCDLTAEARSTRRLVTVAEVAAVAGVKSDKVKAVAAVFLHPDRSFLTMSPSGTLSSATTLDISHEALIRQWGRLSEWVSQEAQSATKYRRLLETARLWKDGKASRLGSPELEIALDWKDHQKPTRAWAKRYGDGFALSMEFLDASVAEQQAQMDLRRKTVRRKVIFLSSVLAIVTTLMIVAGVLWRNSEAQSAVMKDRWIESQLSIGTDAIEEGRMNEGLKRFWWAYTDTEADEPAHTSARNLIAAWSEVAGRPLMHDRAVRNVAFGPDGDTVLTVTDDVAQLWDVVKGEPLPEKVVASDGIWSAIAVSPNGTRVLVASTDSARIYELGTGKPAGTPLVHGEEISMVAFSDDGRTAVTRGDKHTQLWNVQTGEPLGRRWPANGRLFALSPDGSSFIESNGSGATLIDVPSEQSITASEFGPVDFVAFSPDGKSVIRVNSSNLRLWDAGTLQSTEVELRHKDIVTIAFSRDGRTLLTGSDDNTARLWNLQTGSSFGTPLRHEGTVVTAAFSPDGSKVLTGSADNTARLWDVSTSEPVSHPLRHSGTVGSVAFSPDGKTLLTGSIGGGARLWHARYRESVKARTLEAKLPQNGEPVTLTAFDQVHSFNVRTAARPGTDDSNLTGNAAALSPDGSMILTAIGNTLYVWDTKTLNQLKASFQLEFPVVTASFGPRGRTVLAVSGETVLLWDIQDTTRPLQEFRHSSRVLTAAISSDGNTVITGSADNMARLWEVRSGNQIGTPLMHRDQVLSVAFSPDDRRVATGSADNTATIRDTATGDLLGTPLAHRDTVSDLMFSPDGKTLVTASDDTRVRFWDVASGELRGDPLPHPRQVKVARFSPDGRSLLTIDDRGSSTLWDVTPPAADESERLRLSIEWRSGIHVDTMKTIRQTTQAEWLERKRTLDALGGPCDVRTWDALSSAEKDELAGRNTRQ